MFKFFRKLRQQLLVDNRFQKYLLYAVGEIVLVVIGILIALQINNWREDQKRKSQEKYYLNGLAVELDQNQEIIREFMQFHNFKITNVTQVANALFTNTPIQDREDFLFAVEHIGWIYPKTFVTNVWQELNTTGNVELIRDRKLLRQLTELYNDFEWLSNLESEWSTYNLGYRRVTGDVIPFHIREEIAKSLGPLEQTGTLSVTWDLDEIIAELQQIDGVSGYLTDIKVCSRSGGMVYGVVSSSINLMQIELASALEEFN